MKLHTNGIKKREQSFLLSDKFKKIVMFHVI